MSLHIFYYGLATHRSEQLNKSLGPRATWGEIGETQACFTDLSFF